ncbi:hypothetical protein DL766_003015 [Monosporascus sp. MC13-8B]|nr:hypothetical protein DL766_003015 [Monosporascus sp. MC13-8B]
MTREIRQRDRNGQPARTPDVTPEEPRAMPTPTQCQVGCQASRVSPGTRPQAHEAHGNSQTIASVASSERPRLTGGMPANFMDEIRKTACEVVETFQRTNRAPGSLSRCSSPQSTSAPSPTSPTSPSPSTNPGREVVARARAARGSLPRKPGVRFSDRRTFARRPAITSRRASSGTSGSTGGELEHLFDESGQATARSVRFLRGLAKYIVSLRLEKGEGTVPSPRGLADNGRPIQIDEFAPEGGLVVTPEKLAAFYTRYRLETEVFPFPELFGSRARDAPERIADVFFGLDCAYHLTPPPDQPGSRPRVPGLTPAGFSRYLTASLLAYPDEEFRRLERIAADAADGPGSAGVAALLPRPLIRCLLPARPDPGAQRLFAAAFEDLARHLPKPPPSPPTADRCRSPPVASSPSSSSSSSSSPMMGTATTAAAGPEKRGSTTAAASTTATARPNSWRYVSGALRSIHDESAISHAEGAPDSQRAAPGRYHLSRPPGASQTTGNRPAAAADDRGHGEDYFDGRHGQPSLVSHHHHHHHRHPASPVDLHHPPSRHARSMSYQLPAPGPGVAGASRSYSYSVSYVPPTTGMSAANPAPASASINASTAPPLPPPPVGALAYGSTMTRQQQSHAVQAPRPPERTHGAAAPVVPPLAAGASPYPPAVIVSRQQNRDRERERERETRRLPSSSCAHHHHHHHHGGGNGNCGGGGAEREENKHGC